MRGKEEDIMPRGAPPPGPGGGGGWGGGGGGGVGVVVVGSSQKIFPQQSPGVFQSSVILQKNTTLGLNLWEIFKIQAFPKFPGKKTKQNAIIIFSSSS